MDPGDEYMVRQERATRTRMALIRAAAELFAEEGYGPTSLTKISSRAGVSTGALHFHFESKSHLAKAVEQEAAEAVRAIKRLAGDPVDGDPVQLLINAVHGLVSRIAGDVVVKAGLELGTDPAHDMEWTLWWEWQHWVEETLHRAERDGLLATGVSGREAAAAIVAVTVGLELLGRVDSRWLSQHNVTRFWDLLLPGLAHHATLAKITSTPPGTPAGPDT
jgi:AcrR family transcriptional regulator